MPVVAHPPLGKHALFDVDGADYARLNDMGTLFRTLRQSCERGGATVVGSNQHRFQPQGVSVVVVLAESHASIHTYPEHGTYMLDVFTCGPELDPAAIARDAVSLIGGRIVSQQTVIRGRPDISQRTQPVSESA